jgi:hypothetical protein
VHRVVLCFLVTAAAAWADPVARLRDQIAGATGPSLKVTLNEQLDAMLPIVKLLATDARTSLAGATLAVTVKPDDAPALLLEVPLGGKDQAADVKRAQGFALLRRALTSEGGRFEAGEALLLKSLVLSPDGRCRLQARAATPEALVAGLKTLAGETVAGSKAPPVVLADVKLTQIAKDYSFELNAALADANPDARFQGFELIGLGLTIEPALVAAHAPLGDAELGRVEGLEFDRRSVSFDMRGALSRFPEVLRALEEKLKPDQGIVLAALAQESPTAPVARARIGLIDGTLPEDPKRGDVTKAFELIAKTFSWDGAGSRPALRDVRLVDAEVEMDALFATADSLKSTLDTLASAGFTDIAKTKEQSEKTGISVSLKAKIPISK